MKEILVADIMTRDPITVKSDTNLLECAKKMVRKRVGSLVIISDKNLVGFISQRDILWAVVKKSKDDLSKIKAKDISPKKIATVKPSFKIGDAIQKMKKLKFDRLPVVQGKELVGIITVRDILNFKPDFYPELDEFAKIREEAQKLRRVRRAKDKDFMQEGICEECGAQDILYRIHGMLVCESCKNSV